MTADQVADVFGTLATAGVIALLCAAGAAAAPSTRRTLRELVHGSGPALGALFAGVSTAGSLWFSEGAHFPPCTLCWYQRIAMYPLAVLLTLAALRGDRGIRVYGIVLAVMGATISGYHVLVELYPSLSSGSCDPVNPCSIRWVEGLGFWTIPRMAGVGFLLVAASLLADGASSDGRGEPPTGRDRVGVAHR